MTKLELLIIAVFATLAYCTEIEDVEPKKRGAGKGTNLNTIPSGAQKQDYTYSIYPSNPSSQSSSSAYQSQAPNSFYPSQASSQYYTSAITQTESPSYTLQQQPQATLTPPTTSQFVPLNFIPNSGYQTKYHIVPTKSNGNIHLAIYRQPNNYPSPPIVPYAPQLFSPHPTNQINPQTSFNLTPQTGHFNIPPNYQQLSLGGSYLGHPSTMLLFGQPSLNTPYNNLLYDNPLQNFYNYYSSNPQNRFNSPYVPRGVTNDYEKIHSSVTQNISKEDNDISHNSEYTSPSETSPSYESAYSASSTSYTKL